MRTLIYTFSALLFLSFTVTAHADDGFKPIFDGTLNGWKAADMSYWSIEDGAITAKSTDDKIADRNHYLVWQGGKLGDFELKLTHRMVSTHNVNGGFQFRSEMFDGDIPDDCRGYQVDNNLGTDWLVRLYDEFGRHTLAWRGQRTEFNEKRERIESKIKDVKKKAHFDLQKWHEYHLICKGEKLTLKVDGKLVAEVIDNDLNQQDFEGILALQLHSGPPMVVQFKDIMIKKL